MEAYDFANNNFDTYSSDYQTYLSKLTALGVTFDDNGNMIIPEGAEGDQAWMDSFNETLEGLQSASEGMYSSLEEMIAAYSQAVEEVMGYYDAEVEKLSNINSLYSTSIDLLKLVRGQSQGYAENIENYFTTIRNNSKESLALAQEQLEAAQLMYTNDYETATDEQKKLLEENLSSAANAVLEKSKELAEATATAFSEKFSAAIDSAFGGSLAKFSEEWDRSLYFDERYLDETNKAYSLNDLERRIQKSIDETDSYSAQKRLNKLKEQELEMLRKKDKLTQDDLDRANARYELELKRIALEEAQATASKMKLVRDASGNYSYQYVADQEKVSEAEAEVATAENELYNMYKDQEKETIGLLTEKYQEAAEVIGGATTEEEKQALYDMYFGNEGVITLLEEDLQQISSESDMVGYNSPYRDTIDKLMAIDKDNIQEQFTEALTEFTNANAELSQIISTLFGESGPLASAIGSLESTVTSVDLLDGETLVNNLVPDLSAIFSDTEGSLVATFESAAATISKVFEAKIKAITPPKDVDWNAAISSNTVATEALTTVLTNKDFTPSVGVFITEGSDGSNADDSGLITESDQTGDEPIVNTNNSTRTTNVVVKKGKTNARDIAFGLK